MDLKLIRTLYREDGVFGFFTTIDGKDLSFSTLEHAYLVDGKYEPKVPPGEYVCIRGMHLLPGMTQPFETFEISHVPNHLGILVHPGCYNKDSAGCVLVGESIKEVNERMRLINSRTAFVKFMALQAGVQSFQLTILDQ